ncbi:MAG: PepSY domain-containing protein, partial [Alphaproteobacteria bacterium]
RDTFGQKHIIDQVVGVAIAAHEGQLFAPLNQILGVVTALGLITLCVSAFIMWRRRAPDGVLGAPPPIPDAQIGAGLAVIIVVAALLLPVLGASLIVLALLEWLVLRRWGPARRWLGLKTV